MRAAVVTLVLFALPCGAIAFFRRAAVSRRLPFPRAIESAPFSYRRLDHIVLRCAKLEETLKFYLEILGATPEWLDRFDGTLHHVRVGDSLIDLIAYNCDLAFAKENPVAAQSTLDHLALRADYCVEEAERWFRNHNIPVVTSGERFGADGQGFSMYIKDPEGNTIELKADAVQP